MKPANGPAERPNSEDIVQSVRLVLLKWVMRLRLKDEPRRRFISKNSFFINAAYRSKKTVIWDDNAAVMQLFDPSG